MFRHGHEPDVRFSLANERTFLAWTRTALALMAGGVALEALALDMYAPLRLAAALVLIVAGIVLPVVAWFEWARVERRMRQGRPLPHPPTGIILAVAVISAGVLVLLAILR